MTATVSSHMAAELAGVTYRQVDHWCRSGYIAPAVVARRSGSRRRFSERDIDMLRVFGRISRFVNAEKGVAGDLGRFLRRTAEALADPADDGPMFLVITGDRAFRSSWPIVASVALIVPTPEFAAPAGVSDYVEVTA